MILLSMNFFHTPMLIILVANYMLKWTWIKRLIASGWGDLPSFLGRKAPASDAHHHASN